MPIDLGPRDRCQIFRHRKRESGVFEDGHDHAGWHLHRDPNKGSECSFDGHGGGRVQAARSSNEPGQML